MRRPSGDHAGASFTAGLFVRRATSEPSAFIVYISVLPSLSDTNAMRPPRLAGVGVCARASRGLASPSAQSADSRNTSASRAALGITRRLRGDASIGLASFLICRDSRKERQRPLETPPRQPPPIRRQSPTTRRTQAQRTPASKTVANQRRGRW